MLLIPVGPTIPHIQHVQNEIVYALRFIPGSDGFNFPPYSGNANLLVLDENWIFFYNIWCLNVI